MTNKINTKMIVHKQFIIYCQNKVAEFWFTIKQANCQLAHKISQRKSFLFVTDKLTLMSFSVKVNPLPDILNKNYTVSKTSFYIRSRYHLSYSFPVLVSLQINPMTWYCKNDIVLQQFYVEKLWKQLF